MSAKTSFQRLSAPILATVTLACSPGATDSGAEGRLGTAAIQTDTSAFRFERTPDALELEIPTVYTNLTAETVYIARCGAGSPNFTLEKRDVGGWRQAFVPICPMILAPPIEVAAGASHSDTVRIEAAMSPDVAPRLEVESIPGTYRLVYSIFARWDAEQGLLEQPLPEEQRLSNPFEIAE